jgi:ankyrin repeat protein
MQVSRVIMFLCGMAVTMSQAMNNLTADAKSQAKAPLVEQLMHEIQAKPKPDIASLLAQGVDPNECAYGQNALHVAAKFGKTDALRQLIAGGAQVDKGASSFMNASALCFAVYYGHDDTVQELIAQHAHLNYTLDKILATPLHIAAMKGRYKITKMLIDAGANVNARNNFNCTPLHVVAECGRLDFVQVMQVKKRDGDRTSQVPEVIPINAYVAIADLLITHNPKLLDINPLKGTPLHLAARNCQPGMVSLLIQRGADLFARRPTATPLHEAVVGFAAEKAKQPQNASEAFKLMQAFIYTPSKEVVQAAKRLVFPVLCCFNRLKKGEGIGMNLPKDMRKMLWKYCLVPFLVDEQIRVLERLFEDKMKLGALDWTSCELATYLVGKSGNKDLSALADSINPAHVQQHRESIYAHLMRLAKP